ncbi:hypothetical protein SLEP1_g43492 [Rubroshorea leprosula]|uniref:Uncharacterized protein n=1 Tax=Rubroshorea leprosula TaxID=152421 RepID=A0AAV5LDN8_9ROSI|nr:hypothetical protein SLEP1_g43492 [Rubroshorea leprosula]
MPNSILLPASQQSTMEMILFRIDLGLAHCFACNYAERRGGLNLFWQDEFAVQISSFLPLSDLGWALLFWEQLCREKPSHIEVVIVDPGGCQWLLTESNFHAVKEDDGVLQGQHGPQAGKGALDPLLTYDSQGLLRIGTDGHMFGCTCRRIGYLATAQRRTTPLLLIIIF